MNLAERIQAAGITLPPPPAPVAAYIPAICWNDLVLTSGQLPLKDGHIVLTGPLQSEDQVEAGAQAAAQCLLNAIGAALAVDPEISRLLKLTVFVASGPGFIWQHLVANGASQLAQQIFEPYGQHARSAVGVSSLPLGAAVEIEAIFGRAVAEAQ